MVPISSLEMTSPRCVAVKSAPTSRLVLILPVWGQKVKGVSPSPLEVLIGSREEEPAGPTDRTAVTTGLRHNLDARLQELQSQCGCEIRA